MLLKRSEGVAEAEFQQHAKRKEEVFMEPSERKLAQKRLSALELAKALGSVSEACRQRGISRSRFYEYKNVLKLMGWKA